MTSFIGSISHGTMRSEDLIPCFLNLLKELDKDKQHTELIEQVTQNTFEVLENDEDTMVTFKRETAAAKTYYNTANTYSAAKYAIMKDGVQVGRIVSGDVSAFSGRTWEVFNMDVDRVIPRGFQTLREAKAATIKYFK